MKPARPPDRGVFASLGKVPGRPARRTGGRLNNSSEEFFTTKAAAEASSGLGHLARRLGCRLHERTPGVQSEGPRRDPGKT